MHFERHRECFRKWLEEHMKQGRADTPGRLVTLMAALERLRDNPSLAQKDHVTPSGQQLIKHNRYVQAALLRRQLPTPLREFGRRASNLMAWIPSLLDWLETRGFVETTLEERAEFLEDMQAEAAERVRAIIEENPLIARYNLGASVAIIADILDQAQEKHRAKDVAEYLVGAKIQLKYGLDAADPKNVNTPSRERLADFRVGTTAIEVTVGTPDDRHIEQIRGILADTRLEVWLLVRQRDRDNWQKKLDSVFGRSAPIRITVNEIEMFLGQNVTEIGKFDQGAVVATLKRLFSRYNEGWLPAAGSSGIRIDSRDPEYD